MHEWDILIEYVQFHGVLRVGSVGILKPKGAPVVDLVVTELVPPHSYTNEFTLFGSTFTFHHELEELDSNTVSMRFWVEARGLMAKTFAPLMRKDIEKKLPILMNNFKEQFEHED